MILRMLDSHAEGCVDEHHTAFRQTRVRRTQGNPYLRELLSRWPPGLALRRVALYPRARERRDVPVHEARDGGLLLTCATLVT